MSNLIKMMQAFSNWEDEVIARDLPVPGKLRDELMNVLRAVDPEIVQWLQDRLLYGGYVLDQHGGIKAPQHLWDLWEALLLAWQYAGWAEEARIQMIHAPRRKPRGGHRKPNNDPVFRLSNRETRQSKGLN